MLNDNRKTTQQRTKPKTIVSRETMRLPDNLLSAALLAISLLASPTFGQQCTVCPDGSSLAGKDKPFTLPGYEAFVQDCGDLELFAPLEVQGSDLCNLVQSINSYCGCPDNEQNNNANDNACHLCGNGVSVPDASFNELVPDYQLSVALGDQVLPALCGLVDAELKSNNIENSQECQSARQTAASLCCGDSGDEPPSDIFDDDDDDESPAEPTSSPCNICRTGGNVMFPEKNISSTLDGIGLDWYIELGLPTTCQAFSTLVASTIESGTSECDDSRFLGGVCGCPPVEDPCHLCTREDDEITDPDRILTLSDEFSFSCQDMNDTMPQFYARERTCLEARYLNYLCGCPRIYVGADTDAKKKALAWVPRASAMLSLMGSVLIMRHLIKQSRTQGRGGSAAQGRISFYHSLIFGMSCMDIFGSLAYLVGPAAIPEEDQYGETDIYGAVGTEKTCRVQGFFIEMALIGSAAYNCLLTVYYVAVIVRNLKEWQLKPYQKYFHALAIAMSLGFAAAGIRHYVQLFWFCHIAPPPYETTRQLVNIFMIGPICGLVGISVINLSYVYIFVSRQNRAARRWRMEHQGENFTEAKPRRFFHSFKGSKNGESSELRGSQATSSKKGANDTTSISDAQQTLSRPQQQTQQQPRKVENVVLWQATLFFTAYLFTWTFYFVGTFFDDPDEHYEMYMTMGFFAPLQGFFNWIVYMRPTWATSYHKWRAAKARERTQRENNQQAQGMVVIKKKYSSNTESGTSAVTTQSFVPESDDKEMALGVVQESNENEVAMEHGKHPIATIEEGEDVPESKDSEMALENAGEHPLAAISEGESNENGVKVMDEAGEHPITEEWEDDGITQERNLNSKEGDKILAASATREGC